jgi:hypothetical protein
VWFAAKSIIAGSDPYQLVGTGKTFELGTRSCIRGPRSFIPATFRESVILAFTSSAAHAAEIGLLQMKSITVTGRIVGAIIIFSTYVPCLLMILRRPNVTETRSPASV